MCGRAVPFRLEGWNPGLRPKFEGVRYPGIASFCAIIPDRLDGTTEHCFLSGFQFFFTFGLLVNK